MRTFERSVKRWAGRYPWIRRLLVAVIRRSGGLSRFVGRRYGVELTDRAPPAVTVASGYRRPLPHTREALNKMQRRILEELLQTDGKEN